MRKSQFAYGPFVWINKALASIALVFALAAPVKGEQISLLAYGDSLTQGYGLLEQNGFVPQMRVWLKAQGADVRLVNAGVSGDTTAGGAARIDWTLSDDIQGIAVALGGNDLLRGLPPEQARANLGAILQAASAKDVPVLLIGMNAPGNYGAEYKAAFDAIYPELSAEYDTLFAESFFLGLQSGDAPLDPAAVQGFMQSDGVHPNAAGVRKIVEGLGPFYLELMRRAQGVSSLEKS